MNLEESFVLERKQRDAAMSPPPGALDPTDALADSFKRLKLLDSQQRVIDAQSINAANSQSDSALAARAAPIAKQIGLPQAAVEADVAGFQRQATAQRNAQIIATSPLVARWVANNPDAARIAHDEYDKLSSIEKVFEGSKDFGYGVAQGLGGAYSATGLALNRMLAPAASLVGAGNWWQRQMIAPLEADAKVFQEQGGLSQMIGQIGGSLAGMLSQITFTGGGQVAIPETAGVMTNIALSVQNAMKSMAIPAATSAVNTGAEIYKATGDPLQTMKASAISAANMIGIGVIPLSVAGNLWQRTYTGAIANAAQSEATRAAWNMVMPEQFRRQFDPQQFATDVVTGSVMGALMGPRPEVNIPLWEGVREVYRKSVDAQQAIQVGETIDKVTEIAALVNLKKASPEDFAKFMEVVTDKTSLEALYVDPTVLGEALAQSKVDVNTMPDVAKQIADPVPGGDVRISVADFVTHIAGTDAQAALTPHLKASPDGMTRSEGESFYKKLEPEMEKRAKELSTLTEEQQKYQAETEQIQKMAYDELTVGGKRSPQVAKVGAKLFEAFVTTNAEKMGASRLELAKRINPKVITDALDGDSLAQSAEPFYSELSRQIDALPMKMGDAAAWKQALKGLLSKGVKKDEIVWSGLEEFLSLAEGKVTKQQVADFLAGNGVRVTETVLGATPTRPSNARFTSALEDAANQFSDQELVDGVSVLATVDGYDLSKQVDSVSFERSDFRGDHFVISFKQKNGETVRMPDHVEPNKLADVVGKELAQKIIDSGEKEGTFTGLDLRVGGEGMRVFYDTILPNVAKDVLRKVGGDGLKTVEMPAGKPSIEKAGSAYYEVPSKVKALSQLGFDITPAMREKAAGGLPLFQAVGSQPTGRYIADAGPARDMPLAEMSVDLAYEVRRYAGMSTQIAGIETLKDTITKLRATIDQLSSTDNAAAPEIIKHSERMVKEAEAALAKLEARAKAQAEAFSTGKPVTVRGFHGSNSGDIAKAGFDPAKLGTNTGAASARMGFFFSGTPKTSEAYAGDAPSGPLPDTGVYNALDEMWRESVHSYFNEHSYQDVPIAALRQGAEEVGMNVFKADGRKSRPWQLVDKESGKTILTGETELELYDTLRENGNDEFYWRAVDAMLENSDDYVRMVLGELEYAEDREKTPTIYPARLHMANPLVHDYKGETYREDSYAKVISNAKKAGHDSVILLNTYDGGSLDNIFVVFDPEQVEHSLQQGSRRGQINLPLRADGTVDFNQGRPLIALLKEANLSTYSHELGHLFVEVYSDIVFRGEAPVSIQKDLQTLLDYAGIKDNETWRSMTINEKRIAHEKVAEAFEQYLWEGKAPSVELRGVFRKIKSWMKSIYRSLRGLGVELTPEVRGVFDRMLASEAEIAEANAKYAPLFKTAEEAGMTPSRWEAYMSLDRDKVDAALEEYDARKLRDMQWLSNAKSRTLREMQRKGESLRAEVRDEVTAEVDAMPVFLALDDIKQSLPAFKERLDAWKADSEAVKRQAQESVMQSEAEVEQAARAWDESNPQPQKPPPEGAKDVDLVAARKRQSILKAISECL